MITTTTPRRRVGQRLSSALWGLLVMGAGALMIVSFSGYDVDLELLAIILLGSLGGWLILSAALSGLGRSREVKRATAPVVEETLDDLDDTVADVDDTLTELDGTLADADETLAETEQAIEAQIRGDEPNTDASPSEPSEPSEPSDKDGTETDTK